VGYYRNAACRFGAYLSIRNAIVVWVDVVRKKNIGSIVCLYGGLSGAIGLTIAPLSQPHHWWWLPFLLDWGCLPGLLAMVIYVIYEVFPPT
jgi:hypothetical protein